jgi:heavy metal sensor kinase
MKSIRLSLMVYSLGLLALALGAASWFVDETAARTLRDKEGAAEELIQSQHKERCREEEKRRDEQLLSEAQTFNKLIQLEKFFRGRDLNAANAAALVAANALQGAPSSPPTFATDLLARASVAGWGPGTGPGGPPRADRAAELYQRYYVEFFHRVPAIHLNEDELAQDAHPHITQYFQIDVHWRADWSSSYRSHSLEGEPLPGDPAALFPQDRFPDWTWDEVRLNSGATVRRVVLKTPWARPNPVRVPPYTPRGGTPPPPPAPAAPPTGPALYIQCAYDVADRDRVLRELAGRRDEELAGLKAQTSESLRTLRARLLAISGATFAATVVGTWLLVWLGLTPLRRLSDAVSRVSEKDFRLQFEERRLPAELRPIVERLTHTLRQLQAAFAREKQATADISHELRTPLAALLTMTEVGLRKPRTAEEYRELLEDCRLSGQQMNRAVERLLALARLDAGVAVMRPERVDVAALAEQCAAVVRPLAEARGLSLRVRGGDGAQLVADPDKLREVLTNLLHNAIEYNRPQGSVEVAVARENGHVRVEVRDTGIGIPPEAREHIFERFYRADRSRGEDGLHAGLGLAIVKGYVDLMGGTIGVESAEGRGSTFRLELPVERPRGAAEARGRN